MTDRLGRAGGGAEAGRVGAGGRRSSVVAVMLPLVWLFSILGAGFGGGLLSGGISPRGGYLLSREALERRPQPRFAERPTAAQRRATV